MLMNAIARKKCTHGLYLISGIFRQFWCFWAPSNLASDGMRLRAHSLKLDHRHLCHRMIMFSCHLSTKQSLIHWHIDSLTSPYQGGHEWRWNMGEISIDTMSHWPSPQSRSSSPSSQSRQISHSHEIGIHDRVALHRTWSLGHVTGCDDVCLDCSHWKSSLEHCWLLEAAVSLDSIWMTEDETMTYRTVYHLDSVKSQTKFLTALIWWSLVQTVSCLKVSKKYVNLVHNQTVGKNACYPA